MAEYLFSYGTLQKPELQEELFGRKLTGFPDSLTSHKQTALEINDPAFLAKGEKSKQLTVVYTGDPSDSIKGTVFEVTEKELLIADQYEPAGYHRLLVQLNSGETAWIYIAG